MKNEVNKGNNEEHVDRTENTEIPDKEKRPKTVIQKASDSTCEIFQPNKTTQVKSSADQSISEQSSKSAQQAQDVDCNVGQTLF